MMSSRDMKEVEYPHSDGQPMAESPDHAAEAARREAEARVKALEEELKRLRQP
jgi:hypothetical protein